MCQKDTPGKQSIHKALGSQRQSPTEPNGDLAAKVGACNLEAKLDRLRVYEFKVLDLTKYFCLCPLKLS